MLPQTTWPTRACVAGRLPIPTKPYHPTTQPNHPLCIADYVGHHVPRLLINREKAAELTREKMVMGFTRGFNWGDGNYR